MKSINTSVNQRVGLLISEYSRLSQRAFAEKLGVSQSSIAALFGRGSQPSFDTLQKILSAFPEVSGDWLMTGREPMLRENGLSPAPITAPLESIAPATLAEAEHAVLRAEIALLRAQQQRTQAQVEALLDLAKQAQQPTQGENEK